MERSLTVPIAICIAGVVLAGAVYLSVRHEPSTSSGNGDPILVRPVGSTDHILGSPAAPVQIVEYADFDCEFCRGFSATLHQIVANEGAAGQIAWVYREFPLSEIHPNALAHAEAAECVAATAGNDAFWAFADSLFKNQPADPATYGTLAAAAGVKGDAFASCYASASSSVLARIQADRQNALAVGARGTPYSLILVAGHAPVVMDGAYTYDAVKQLVDQALAGAK
ncbi:thioredoxin domain-containing protein [Candidatus Kaiserbacteria bacterium]|nr:thioredoxin domain-containing protein [Candidatus Kaiserbacteria bacterium]